MSTRYPVMHPRLEHRYYWHGFHYEFISCVMEELNAHLSDRLPEVCVPLLEGDEDTFLDLQAAFDHAFRAGRYAQMIDDSDPLRLPET